jgi:hypothetical protein
LGIHFELQLVNCQINPVVFISHHLGGLSLCHHRTTAESRNFFLPSRDLCLELDDAFNIFVIVLLWYDGV